MAQNISTNKLVSKHCQIRNHENVLQNDQLDAMQTAKSTLKQCN